MINLIAENLLCLENLPSYYTSERFEFKQSDTRLWVNMDEGSVARYNTRTQSGEITSNGATTGYTLSLAAFVDKLNAIHNINLRNLIQTNSEQIIGNLN